MYSMHDLMIQQRVMYEDEDDKPLCTELIAPRRLNKNKISVVLC